MTSSTSSYNLRTFRDGIPRNSIVQILVLSSEPEWPSDMLTNGAKPVVHLVESPPTAREIADRVFSGQGIDLNCLAEAMFNRLGLVEGVLTEDWISYGILIGRKNHTITPKDLIDIRQDKSLQISASQNTAVISDDDRFNAMAISTSHYRINIAKQSNNQNFTKQTRQSIISLLRNEGVLSSNSDSGICSEAGIGVSIQGTDLEKLCAALDMFLNKFPSHKYKFLRKCIIPTCYKDSSMISMHDSFRKSMGWTHLEGAKNIIDTKSAGEFITMWTKGTEELNDPYSYLPYHTSLGISAKSPFSATVSPHLYTFYAVSIAATGASRGLNAKRLSDIPFEKIATSALLMIHHATTHNKSGRRIFGTEETAESSKKLEEGLSRLEDCEALAMMDDLDDSDSVSMASEVSNTNFSAIDQLFIKCARGEDKDRAYRKVYFKLKDITMRPGSVGEALLAFILGEMSTSNV